MTNYIIPVYGKSTTDPAQWRFAVEAAGYKIDVYRRLVATDDLCLTAKSPTGDVQFYTAKGDDIITIETDAPANLIEALWGMTGDLCAFIGIAKTPVAFIDDFSKVQIAAIN